jgi:hypothetical protein
MPIEFALLRFISVDLDLFFKYWKENNLIYEFLIIALVFV